MGQNLESVSIKSLIYHDLFIVFRIAVRIKSF